MRRTRLQETLILLGLVALAYWPVVACGFVWDDDDYVTQNPVLRTASGILDVWFSPTSLPQYYPLVHTTFWLEYRLWGPHPLGYHLVNVALHFGAGLALLRLLQRLRLPGALLAAGLFVAHPVHVESVAWVTERKNVLSMLFMLLAALQWLRWREAGGRRSWWLATALFLAALLSKTVAAPLPAALLVVQWWRDGRVARRDVMSLLPWFGLGLALGLLTAWLEVTHVRAAGEPWQLAGGERLLVAGRAVWFYLGSLLWPVGLCFNYPRWQLDAGAASQWLPAAAALAALGVAIAMRARIGRGPAAALLLFGGMLFPALGFFDVYPFRFSYVADHFQYHADAAALAALGAGAARLAQGRLPAAAARALAGALLVGLAVAASALVRDYEDLETLWRTTLARNPTSMLAMVNLGGVLLERGDTQEAKAIYEECLSLHPDSHESLGNLARIAHEDGDLATARRLYEASLALRDDSAPVLSNFAQLELQEGNGAAALRIARRVVGLAPDMYDGHRTLARVAAAQRSWQECVEQADWILVRTPEAVDVRALAARALLELGRYEQALQNAAVALIALPGVEELQVTFARAMALLLRTRPTAMVAAEAARICRSGGIDPAPLLPRIAAELRALGEAERAAALGR